MHPVGALDHETVREALVLLGHPEPPAHRGAAQRALRGHLGAPGTIRAVLDAGPDGAREAFVRVCADGAAAVEDLLGRGWWGRGTLPPPLDWLQRRALLVVGDDGLVHPVDEARDGFLQRTLALDGSSAGDAGSSARVEPAACVVVTESAALLDRVVTVPAAGLRAVASTVAVSHRSPAAVESALRAAGIALDADATVAADQHAPPLPGTAEDAVGPRAIRAVLDRAVAEGRQVRLRYFASSRGGAATDRVVDPWRFADDLLVGYCHLRTGERTFALDRIGQARLLASVVEHPDPASP